MLGLQAKELISRKEKKERDKRRKWIPSDIIKVMLGGRWPKFNFFNFGSVGVYHCEGIYLVPYDNIGDLPSPGPNFMLVMVDDIYSDHPVLVIPDKFKERIRFMSEYKD